MRERERERERERVKVCCLVLFSVLFGVAESSWVLFFIAQFLVSHELQVSRIPYFIYSSYLFFQRPPSFFSILFALYYLYLITRDIIPVFYDA